MRRLLVCLVLLLSLSSMAQEGTPTPTVTPATSASPTPQTTATPQATATPDALGDEEDQAQNELKLLRQHMEDAMNAQDIDSVLEGLADEVVFTTMNGDVVTGKDKVRAYFDRAMTGPEARVKEMTTRVLVDEPIIFYGEQNGIRFAIAHGHSEDKYLLTDGTTLEVDPRWSATLARDEETWKIVDFHYSVDMFDNPVLDKALSKLALIGAGGLVLGLLLGFFIGRRRV